MLMIRILHSHTYGHMTKLLSTAILFLWHSKYLSLYSVKYRHTCEIEWIQGGKEHRTSLKTDGMPGSKVVIQGVTNFFTRLWVHFGTPLFAGWCPRTPSLPGTRDGPSTPLSPLWALVEESRVTAPCYCSCRAGCRKSKSSACASSFVWNWEEMVQGHLKCSELPLVCSVWAVFAFSNDTGDLKKAKTLLMTIHGLADQRQAKLMTLLHKCENWSEQIGA